jgi:hypothetical protein
VLKVSDIDQDEWVQEPRRHCDTYGELWPL